MSGWVVRSGAAPHLRAPHPLMAQSLPAQQLMHQNHPIRSQICINMHNIHERDITGCWYTYPSEKYEFVTWDDEIPNVETSIQMFQTTNQS
jgi:hypothetical protein